MKIKNLIALAGLFILITSATFSSQKENPENPASTGFSKESFIEFLSHFEKKELPYSLGLNELYAPQITAVQKPQQAKPSKKRRAVHSIQNSPFIPNSRFGKMSRMGTPELIPVARFYPNEKMVAIIYSSSPPFGSDINKTYNLLFYDLKGNLISDKTNKRRYPNITAAYSSVDESMTFTIDKEGRIWNNKYTNIWKENLSVKGILDNEITGYEIKGTEVFEIKENGAVVQLKEIPTTAKASLF
ncbi:MAG: hypothetical protein AAFZ15_01075 [Bacteroidota bacterium]